MHALSTWEAHEWLSAIESIAYTTHASALWSHFCALAFQCGGGVYGVCTACHGRYMKSGRPLDGSYASRAATAAAPYRSVEYSSEWNGVSPLQRLVPW